MAAVVRMKGEISVNSNTGLVGPWKLEKSLAVDEWFGPFTYEVATSTTEQVLGIIATAGLTTITAVAIYTDQNVSVTFGAAASNAPVTLNAGGFIVMQDISTVEISISNSSGNTANISISCGGT